MTHAQKCKACGYIYLGGSYRWYDGGPWKCGECGGREWDGMGECPQFVSSYQGESTYTWRGKTIAVRCGVRDDGHWNYTPADFFRQVVGMVGTIRHYHHYDDGGMHDFPDVALEKFFPGYVRARYTEDWTPEYASERPPLVESPIYGWLAKPWAEEMGRMNIALFPKEKVCQPGL